MNGYGRRRRGKVPFLAGTLLVGGWYLTTGGAETPDVGDLEAIRAESPETVMSLQLESGQTLGQLLNRHTSLSGQQQHSALLALREEVDPTRLDVGTEITFRWLREDLFGEERLRGVEVEVSPDEMVRLGRTDVGWDVDVRETPVWADTVRVAGEITTDLWSAVVLNPDLADLPRQDRYALIDHLDRVYQWQVDFSRQIYSGDRYRMVFERKVRPDGSMREARILGAELETRNDVIHAVRYELDGESGYYEPDGESVQQAFMTRPLEYRRISSGFNMNRRHPVYGDRRPHVGVDYAANTGTPIYATGDGVVVERQYRGGYGNIVTIEHSNDYRTRYAHMNRFVSGLSVGDRVSQGEVIGYVGMTGTATGPHLHYEMHRGGRPVDPLEVDIPSGDPIPDEEWDAWEEHRDHIMAMMDDTEEAGLVRSAVDLHAIPGAMGELTSRRPGAGDEEGAGERDTPGVRDDEESGEGFWETGGD